MSSLTHFLASSDHPVARVVRRVRRAVLDFTLPAPRVVFVPLLAKQFWLQLPKQETTAEPPSENNLTCPANAQQH